MNRRQSRAAVMAAIKGVADITSLTTVLLTGAIQGTYGVGLPPWTDQLGGVG